MLFSRVATTGQKLLVRVIAADAVVGARLKNVVELEQQFHAEVVSQSLGSISNSPPNFAPASLLLVVLDQSNPQEFAQLETLLQSKWAPRHAIVISDGLAGGSARTLLKLQISDWLPSSCSDGELLAACKTALKTTSGGVATQPARCFAFMSAVGGAGATTLALAAASVLSGKGRPDLSGCCVIDLNFQSGSLADYLDIEPNLQLAEVSQDPSRLDGHLLQIMVTRHSSGLAVLAAPPSLSAEQFSAQLIGQLLDQASLQFRHLIIDLPSGWRPWSENVVRGADGFFIVTEMSVSGLRHARRLAEMVAKTTGNNLMSSVIVNKATWFGGGTVKTKHVRSVLGGLLAGYIGERRGLVREAQDHGALLSSIKKHNQLERELGLILTSKYKTHDLAAKAE